MAETEPLVNSNGGANESAYVKDLQKYVHCSTPQLAMLHLLTSANQKHPQCRKEAGI